MPEGQEGNIFAIGSENQEDPSVIAGSLWLRVLRLFVGFTTKAQKTLKEHSCAMFCAGNELITLPFLFKVMRVQCLGAMGDIRCVYVPLGNRYLG